MERSVCCHQVEPCLLEGRLPSGAETAKLNNRDGRAQTQSYLISPILHHSCVSPVSLLHQPVKAQLSSSPSRVQKTTFCSILHLSQFLVLRAMVYIRRWESFVNIGRELYQASPETVGCWTDVHPANLLTPDGRLDTACAGVMTLDYLCSR